MLPTAESTTRPSPSRPAHRTTRGALVGAALGLTALLPSVASAGGFEIPDLGARALGRGGANAVGAVDGTALHYNPGLLAKQRGTRFTYNHSFIWHDTRFARADISFGDDAGTSFGSVRDGEKVFPLGAFAVVSTDFGLDNWTFAAGAYGPHSVGKHNYPEYGPQSFMLTDMNVLLVYYSLAAAWKYRDVFGVGLTAQYVDMMTLDYSLVADATTLTSLDPIPDAESSQLTTTLQLKDRTSATALLGLWYRPHQRVELGLAGRVVPVFLKPKGTMASDKATLNTDDITVTMPLTLPAILRGGARYIHEVEGRNWFDLELNAQWENWSTIDAYDVTVDGQISGQDVADLRLGKNWKDTFSVRLGGDVHVIPNHLTLRAGGYFETGATPNDYSHLDFPSFNRGGIGGGLSAGGRGIYGTIGFLHVFQESRDVTELNGQVFQQRPLRPCPDQCGGASGVPSNAGRFTSRYEILNVGLEIRFAELLRGRKEKRKGGSKSKADAEPAEPTTPSESTAPSEPAVAPAEPTEPTESAAPSEPSEPTAPAEPVEATESADPSEPASPSEPATAPE